MWRNIDLLVNGIVFTIITISLITLIFQIQTFVQELYTSNGINKTFSNKLNVLAPHESLRVSPSELSNVSGSVEGEDNSDLDVFGLKKLYPTELDGREWFAKWDNGRPRTILDKGVDPYDPELHITQLSNDDIGFNGHLEVDGQGTARVSADSGRFYIYFDDFQNKPKWGPNVEMTIYFKFINESELAPRHFIGLKGPTNHFADAIGNSNGRNYGVDFMFDDGRGIRAAKEVVHGVYEAEEKRRVFPDDRFPVDKWVGLKFVLRELNQSGNNNINFMKLEAYIDLTNGRDGGDWKKVHEFIDNGTWADYDTEEYALLSSIIEGGDRGVLDHPMEDPKQVWNVDAFGVALRLDGVLDGYMKNFSVRTIASN